MSCSREMRGRVDGFALPGNYSKAKQTHENWLEPVKTDVEIIGSVHLPPARYALLDLRR